MIIRMNGLVPPNVSINGRFLTNANGDIDTGDLGYEYLISTLSELRAETIEQKFYKIAPGDFMPVDVGFGAFSEEIIQNRTIQSGGSFYAGDIDTNSEASRIAQVDVGLDKIRMPNQNWAKTALWSIIDIAKSAKASNWDVLADKLKSVKTDWDLGIQETAFLGHPTVAGMTGLLNNAEVNINTTLITVPISEMSETQFNAFLAQALALYFANSNDTQDKPDTFVMPASDYLGLTSFTSTTFNNISKIEAMLNAFRKATDNPNFKIKGLSYAQANRNSDRGINKNRYALYKDDPDVLKLNIPVDFTMLEAGTADNFKWTQPAHGQYSGVLINREREVFYIDETAT